MAKKRNQATKKKEWITFNNAVAFIIILLVIAVLRAIVSTETGTAGAKADLEQEAIEVLRTLTNKNMPISVLESNELIEEKVEYLERIGYDKIKSMIGIKNDFCIYFEDATGSVIRIDGINTGIGSNRIYINGEPCD